MANLYKGPKRLGLPKLLLDYTKEKLFLIITIKNVIYRLGKLFQLIEICGKQSEWK